MILRPVKRENSFQGRKTTDCHCTDDSENAPIVILDEATAFTDPENEDKIQQSIAALTKGKTLLVIAHRLSTIRQADNIVVLQNGSIVAQGSQEELLDSCPLYLDMWKAHIGAREWAVSSAKKEENAYV